MRITELSRIFGKYGQYCLIQVLLKTIAAAGEIFPIYFHDGTGTDFVKLFKFLLSPSSLTGTCINVQNYSFHGLTQRWESGWQRV
jgi:hypothetical protein